jgi:2-dehydropantoate 2-reductase
MEPALQSIKHLQVESVLSLQNGVLKNEQLAQTFGWDKVLGAMAHFSAEVLPMGTVRFRTNQGCYLGELPEGTSPRVQTLGSLFARVGIVAQVTPQIQSFEWSKYVAWVCRMAPAVLTRLESYKILQDLPMASITTAILHEMAQLATSRSIPLHDIALFPTKTLSEFAFNDTVTHIRQIGDRWASLLPTAKVSTLHDLEQGKLLVVEETLGYAVRQSAALGIPTPTMDICYKLLAGINHSLQ